MYTYSEPTNERIHQLIRSANVGSTATQMMWTQLLNAPRNVSLDNKRDIQRLPSAGLWIVFIKWIHANKVNAIETRLEVEEGILWGQTAQRAELRVWFERWTCCGQTSVFWLCGREKKSKRSRRRRTLYLCGGFINTHDRSVPRLLFLSTRLLSGLNFSTSLNPLLHADRNEAWLHVFSRLILISSPCGGEQKQNGGKDHMWMKFFTNGTFGDLPWRGRGGKAYWVLTCDVGRCRWMDVNKEKKERKRGSMLIN